MEKIQIFLAFVPEIFRRAGQLENLINRRSSVWTVSMSSRLRAPIGTKHILRASVIWARDKKSSFGMHWWAPGVNNGCVADTMLWELSFYVTPPPRQSILIISRQHFSSECLSLDCLILVLLLHISREWEQAQLYRARSGWVVGWVGLVGARGCCRAFWWRAAPTWTSWWHHHVGTHTRLSPPSCGVIADQHIQSTVYAPRRCLSAAHTESSGAMGKHIF